MSDKMTVMLDRMALKTALVNAIMETIKERGDIDPRDVCDELVLAGAFSLLSNDCIPANGDKPSESFGKLAKELYEKMEKAIIEKETLQ